MTVLASSLDASSPEHTAHREAMLEKLAALDTEHAKALAGGGEKYVARHRERGKLLARERIELLLDPDTPSWSCRRWRPGEATPPRTRWAPRSSPGSGWSRASSA